MEAISYGRPVLYMKGSAIDSTVSNDGFGLSVNSQTLNGLIKF